jgi:imidazoleglycerol-phosphate dehydratase
LLSENQYWQASGDGYANEINKSMDAKGIAKIERKTSETQISLELSINGNGENEISTGIPFLDHMLELFSRHGFFDLNIEAKGDLEIDYHHLVEDLGIALGQAFSKALGDKSGIKRYGYFVAPMDETLVTTAVDLSNRPYLFWQVSVESALVRDFNIQLFKEFFQSFANEVACNLHIRLEHGEEPHHVAEGIFKSLARCMDMATTSEPRLQGKVPSTKGTLSA